MLKAKRVFMMCLCGAQCQVEDKLWLFLLTQNSPHNPLKFKAIPEAFAFLLRAQCKLHFGKGESQNSSALVFVQIVLARPQPVFQWTCPFRGQGERPERSQFNGSEGDTYQSSVLWLQYTEGNWEPPQSLELSGVCSWHVWANNHNRIWVFTEGTTGLPLNQSDSLKVGPTLTWKLYKKTSVPLLLLSTHFWLFQKMVHVSRLKKCQRSFLIL